MSANPRKLNYRPGVQYRRTIEWLTNEWQTNKANRVAVIR